MLVSQSVWLVWLAAHRGQIKAARQASPDTISLMPSLVLDVSAQARLCCTPA
jgi:hypothetical protein